MQKDPNQYLCLALDRVKTFSFAVRTLTELRNLVSIVKFNAVFARLHRSIIHAAHELGFECWVDLKLHDTPDTVRELRDAFLEMDVDFISVHLGGGSQMVRSATLHSDPLKVLGVTVLTSIDERTFSAELGFNCLISDQVVRLARIGKECGVFGVIASGFEVRHIKSELGEGFFVATPGIRFEGSDMGAQKRVMTPYQAISAGSDLLVMGQDLIQGGAPAALRALHEINLALSHKA